jgi:hypothetical protein
LAQETRVEVRGLRELKSAFRQVDKGLNKELGHEFKELAESIAAKVRMKVPKRKGRAASSVKGKGSQRGGAIAFGGSAAPYYPWLDFGGRVGRSKSIYRPFQSSGRYVYPTIAENKDEIIDETDKVLKRMLQKAGFETSGDN